MDPTGDLPTQNAPSASSGTQPSTGRTATPDAFVEIVGGHPCPVCETNVPHLYRAGRGKIYCTNACRQRAYRWRRAHGVRVRVQFGGPAERSIGYRRHALRDHRDPVARVRDRRRREVTVCGVFASPIRDLRGSHDRFVPELPWSCNSCSALIGAGPPGTGIPAHVAEYLPAALR